MDTPFPPPHDGQLAISKTDDEWVFVGGCANLVALPSDELQAYQAGYLKGLCIFTIIGLGLGLLGKFAVLLIS